MTTNELITELEKIVEKYGDMEIFVYVKESSGTPFVYVYDGRVFIELH